jgi:NDP-sugar pyrophosphorylase family protein
MQVLILAGGLGTRMRSVREDLPKALLPVHGRPFLAYQLAWLARQGVRSVLLSVGYRADLIRAFAGDGSAFGLSIAYSEEGTTLRGTAGAIRHAADGGHLDDSFFVLYGDSYLPIDIAPVWEASGRGRVATMTVLRNDGRWDKSNVIYEDGRILLYDKRCLDPAAEGMKHIDYGLLVLSRSLICERVAAGRIMDLADILTPMSREGLLAGYEVHERFYEIGSLEGLEDFSDYVARSRLWTEGE